MAASGAGYKPDLVGGSCYMIPDFWLNEATNVLWLQVRRKLLTPDEAREGLALLQAQLAPMPTADMGLHDIALDIGLAVGQSTYDTVCRVRACRGRHERRRG